MSTIANIERNALQEMEFKNHKAKMAETKTNNHKEFLELNERHENFIGRIKKEFEHEAVTAESEKERKLIEMRNSHKEMMEIERNRLSQELNNLKSAHQAQFGEPKETQLKQINDLKNSQQSRVEDARLQFQKEMARYNET